MTSDWATAVLETNQAFYDAFAQRDLAAMNALWHESLPVVCVHPGWSALLGRERVMDSWRRILGNAASPNVRCLRATVHLLTDVAVVSCYEALGPSRLVATNVFARAKDGWRIVAHQAGPVAQPDDDEDEDDTEEERELDPSELN